MDQMFMLTGQRILSCRKIYMGSQIIIRRLFVSMKSEQREGIGWVLWHPWGYRVDRMLMSNGQNTTLSLDRAGDTTTNVCPWLHSSALPTDLPPPLPILVLQLLRPLIRLQLSFTFRHALIRVPGSAASCFLGWHLQTFVRVSHVGLIGLTIKGKYYLSLLEIIYH